MALSCGLEPSHAAEPDEDYQRRLAVAIAHLSPPGVLARLNPHDRRHLTKITLHDLAGLARHCDPPWTLPAQFPGAAAVAADEPAKEAPADRRARRLARLRELGGDLRSAGKSWHTTGKRGALAALVREEQAKGRPMRDKSHIRADLIAAMGQLRGN